MAQPNVFWPSGNITTTISGTIPVHVTGGTLAISTGTIASVTNIVGGTIAIQTGTLASITNIAGGSIAVTAGTVVIPPVSGTVQVSGGTVAVGVGTVTVTGTVLANLGTGTVAISTGTIASITNVAGGTIAVSTGTLASITNLAAGTIAVSTGTIATVGGTVATQDVRPTVGALTAVTGSTAAHVTLLAANANRKGACVYNNTVINFFMSLGTTAGTGDAAYTVKLTPGSYYEFPFPAFTGSVTAIASGTGGTISVTEFS